MMKRWILVLLLVFALLLTACGDGEEATPVPDEPVTQETEEAAPQETEEPVEEPVVVEPAEIRFTYYADGNEAEVMQGIVDSFMAEHPEITVILDVVPYQTIDEQLPIQVETGEGPDLARITNFGAYQGHSELVAVEPGFVDGFLEDITLVRFEQNGR